MGNKLAISPIPAYDAAVSHLNTMEVSHIKKKFYSISIIDTKKDSVIDFEEYLCIIALFRLGTTDDKIKLLYLMYDGSKNGGNLVKESLRQLLIDSTICIQKQDIVPTMLEEWIQDLQLLSDAMVETSLNQFSSHVGRLDIQEFISFVKVEGTVQGLLQLIPKLIDD